MPCREEEGTEPSKDVKHRRQQRRGYPPVTPNACAKDAVVSQLFDQAWGEVCTCHCTCIKLVFTSCGAHEKRLYMFLLFSSFCCKFLTVHNTTLRIIQFWAKIWILFLSGKVLFLTQENKNQISFLQATVVLVMSFLLYTDKLIMCTNNPEKAGNDFINIILHHWGCGIHVYATQVLAVVS